ncbi:MAG: hypothetical protein KatS3mg097_044 [Candidatus Parcubacteria bacterium]|nr:MAG: hypothetical protein KatS3mg097_044 [Candidatus Parcubacteria bacterium]
MSISDILIILGFVSVFYFLFYLKRTLDKLQEPSEGKFLDLQNKLYESFNLLKQEVFHHFQNFNQTTLEKQEKIVSSTSKIEEIVRNLESTTTEMRSLKEIFVGPKTRGYLGETMLKEIIKTLPSSYYEEQYQLGYDRVDYVLKLNGVLIPIDAKFPVQNFKDIFATEEKNKQTLKRDLIKNLKNKIEDVSRKYILPSKGTIEFALIYLANEAIYYELLSDKDFDEVWEFAREKSVFLTSPKNFELICSSLLLVIRKQEFSQNIHQILANLHQLEKDLLEMSEFFGKAYNQLRNSFANFQEFEKILNRFILNFRSLIKNEEKLEEKIKEKSLI